MHGSSIRTITLYSGHVSLNDTPQGFSETNAPPLSIQAPAQRVCDIVQRVVVGTRDTIGCALVALIVDIPGTGKTTLAKALAQSLGCRFKCI